MKILYDEEAGLRERQDWAENGRKRIRKRKLNNALFALVGLAFFVFYGWLTFKVGKNILREDYILPLYDGVEAYFCGVWFSFTKIAIAGILTWGTMLVITFITPFNWMDTPEWPYVSVNADFTELLADGYKVLDFGSRYDGDNKYVVTLTLEGPDHVVRTTTLFPYRLKKVTRTDIEETTIDLTKGMIYEPYNPA